MAAELLLFGYIVPVGGFDLAGAKSVLTTLTNEEIHEAVAELDESLAAELLEPSMPRQAASRREAERRLVACIDVLIEDRDDAFACTFDGPTGSVETWVTGGLSWGDSPTEAYERAQVIDLLPVSVRDALLRRADTPS